MLILEVNVAVLTIVIFLIDTDPSSDGILFFMHKIRNNKLQLAQQICLISKQTYGIISVATTEISANTNFMKKSISYAASSAWNNLPAEAKSLGISSQKFKTILDHYSPQ